MARYFQQWRTIAILYTTWLDAAVNFNSFEDGTLDRGLGYTTVWSGIHEYNECIPRETMV